MKDMTTQYLYDLQTKVEKTRLTKVFEEKFSTLFMQKETKAMRDKFKQRQSPMQKYIELKKTYDTSPSSHVIVERLQLFNNKGLNCKARTFVIYGHDDDIDYEKIHDEKNAISVLDDCDSLEKLQQHV